MTSPRPTLILAAAVVATGVHLVVLAYLQATTWMVGKLSRTSAPPDRRLALARRNRARTSRFIRWGLATCAVAAVVVRTGTGDKPPGEPLAPWRLAVAGFAAGFNAVAFLIESAGVVARRRLLADRGARLENHSMDKHDDEH